MAVVSWILAGVLVGWVAGVVMGRVEQKDYLLNIPAAIGGAVIAGLAMSLWGEFSLIGFGWNGYLASVVGALIAVAIVFAIPNR